MHAKCTVTSHTCCCDKLLGIPEMHVGKSTVPHRQAPHLRLISQENHAPVIRRNNNYYKLNQNNELVSSLNTVSLLKV